MGVSCARVGACHNNNSADDRRRTGDGTRGQLSFGEDESTCAPPAGRHCLQQRHGLPACTGSTDALSGYMVSQPVCISRGLTQH